MEPEVTIVLTAAERQLLVMCLEGSFSDIEDLELQGRVGRLLDKVNDSVN